MDELSQIIEAKPDELKINVIPCYTKAGIDYVVYYRIPGEDKERYLGTVPLRGDRYNSIVGSLVIGDTEYKLKYMGMAKEFKPWQV